MCTAHFSGHLGGGGGILLGGVYPGGVYLRAGVSTQGIYPDTPDPEADTPLDPEVIPPRGQADTCKNITFPQLLLRAIKTGLLVFFHFSEQIFEGYFTSVEGFYWTYNTLSSDCYWFEKYLWWRLAPAPPCLNGPVETHSSEISAIVSEWCKFHSVYIVGTALLKV